MGDLTAYDVFNGKAITIGSITMVFCLFLQAVLVHIATRTVKPLIARLVNIQSLLAAQLVFLVGAIALLFVHLTQIYVWGYALYLTNVIYEFNTAVIFAGSTYTTVGFVNDPLPQEWQLLTVIMAASGLFSFGWSTSLMFILAQKLYPGDTPS